MRLGNSLGLITDWILRKVGKKVVLGAALGFYFTAVIAFYSFVVNAIIKLYNLISSFLSYIQNPPSGSESTVLKMFGMLDCLGIISAFNASKPLLFSAIVFLLTKALYKVLINAYRDLINTALKLI